MGPECSAAVGPFCSGATARPHRHAFSQQFKSPMSVQAQSEQRSSTFFEGHALNVPRSRSRRREKTATRPMRRRRDCPAWPCDEGRFEHREGSVRPFCYDAGMSCPIRDRLWLWCHPSGSHTRSREQHGIPGHSAITPAEAAAYLGIPNVLFVRYELDPQPPLEPHAASLTSLNQVVWSIEGGGGGDVDAVLALTKTLPNLRGVILDDYFARVAVGDVPERPTALSPPGHAAGFVLDWTASRHVSMPGWSCTPHEFAQEARLRPHLELCRRGDTMDLERRRTGSAWSRTSSGSSRSPATSEKSWGCTCGTTAPSSRCPWRRWSTNPTGPALASGGTNRRHDLPGQLYL